jgi:predicted nuclease of predicted toxin-antitoxin system
LAGLLTNAGYNSVHLRDYGIQSADDVDVLERARVEGRILISADSDFATLLALQEAAQPSFILFRQSDAVTAEQYAGLLLANLTAISSDLERGCVAVFRRDRVRVRLLPIAPF